MTTATQLQLRRGTATQCDAMTPAEGEPIVDLTHDRYRLGDGLTAGGIVIANVPDLQKQAFTYCAATGTGDAIVLTTTIASLAGGVFFEFAAPGSNSGTGTAMLQAGSTANSPVMKIKNGALVDLEIGDIISGLNYRVNWNVANSVYQLGTSASAGGAMTLIESAVAASNILEFKTGFSTDFNSYKIIYELNGSGNFHCQYSEDVGVSYVGNAYVNTVNGAATSSDVGAKVGSGAYVMGELSIYDSFVVGPGFRNFISVACGSAGQPQQGFGNRVDGSGVPITGLRFVSPGGGTISAGRGSLYGMKV